MTTAPDLSDVERAVVAKFEAAEEPEEIRVEQVARAIWEADNPALRYVDELPVDIWADSVGTPGHDRYVRLARAAIAAMDPVR